MILQTVMITMFLIIRMNPRISQSFNVDDKDCDPYVVNQTELHENPETIRKIHNYIDNHLHNQLQNGDVITFAPVNGCDETFYVRYLFYNQQSIECHFTGEFICDIPPIPINSFETSNFFRDSFFGFYFSFDWTHQKIIKEEILTGSHHSKICQFRLLHLLDGWSLITNYDVIKTQDLDTYSYWESKLNIEIPKECNSHKIMYKINYKTENLH